MKNSKRLEQMQSLHTDYNELIRLGKSHDEALNEFEYLHPVTLSIFKKYLAEFALNQALKEFEDKEQKSS